MMTEGKAMDEQKIRDTATNIIMNFLMEHGIPRQEAWLEACDQVKRSSLNLLKKIMAGHSPR
jgi:hypothetical protein